MIHREDDYDSPSFGWNDDQDRQNAINESSVNRMNRQLFESEALRNLQHNERVFIELLKNDAA